MVTTEDKLTTIKSDGEASQFTKANSGNEDTLNTSEYNQASQLNDMLNKPTSDIIADAIDGQLFKNSSFDALNNNDFVQYVFTSGSDSTKRYSLIGLLAAAGVVEIDVFSSPTFTPNTPEDWQNSFILDSVQPLSLLFKNPTVTDVGTQLPLSVRVGVKNQAGDTGGTALSATPFIFNENETILLQITSRSTNNIVTHSFTLTEVDK